MSTSSRASAGRRPVDAAARERLRNAQTAESLAVAKYLATSERAAAARDVLAHAELQVAEAVTAVMTVSGAERTLALLGIDKAGLRALLAPKRST